MQRRCWLRLVVWTTFFAVLVQNALQMSLMDDPGQRSTTDQDKDAEHKIVDSDVQKPVKRFIGSLARAGELPISNKRVQVQAEDEEEEKNEDLEVESVKRYLGSVARQGFIHGKRDEVFDNFEEPDKRHISSALLMGNPRFGSASLGSKNNKRFLGSLARAGELGQRFGYYNNDDNKRHLGSVVRGNGLRYRSKRSLMDSPIYIDYSEETDEEDYDGDDLLIPIKRHIASLARNGWLPHVRALRQQAKQPLDQHPNFEEDYKRIYYRSPSSASSRSHLLKWLRQEEERLRQEAEAKEQLNGAHGKRTIAALARSGELPIRYRSSRSADRLPAPPFMRMPSYRGSGSGQPNLKPPHAFVSSHVDGWGRRKRNVLPRQNGQNDQKEIQDPCPTGNCTTEPKGEIRGDEKAQSRLPSFSSSSSLAEMDEGEKSMMEGKV